MRKLFVICFLSFIFVLSVSPLFVSAQTVTPTMPGIWTGGYWGPLVSCRGLRCTSLCDLFQTFEYILAFGETLALYIAAPVLFVWGGIIIMTAGANSSQIQKGKKILTGTLIGILIVLSAYLIISTIVNTLLPSAGKYVGGFSGRNPFTCTVPPNQNTNGGGSPPSGSPPSGGGSPIGTTCTSNSQCQTANCAGGVCAVASYPVGSYPIGASCTFSGQCQSNNCVSGTCQASGGGGGFPSGTVCSQNSDCQSNICDFSASPFVCI